jgi:hypothetical protein
MSYQAVIRNSSNQLVVNQSVGMQISILQDSVNGTAVFIERHFPTTNINGQISIEIGEGTLVMGDFSGIDWANGSFFIKSETDLNGGANYTITGTSQLLSVPYSLYAGDANKLDGMNSSDFSPANHDHSDYAANDHSHGLLPVAYGSIRYDGVITTRSVNVESCVWNSTYDRYEITIKNDFYYSIDDIAVVTISGSHSSCPAGTVARQSSVSGKLLVYMVQADGTNRQCSFRFVAYQGLNGY